MKKSFSRIALLATVVLSVLFSGCKNDDDAVSAPSNPDLWPAGVTNSNLFGYIDREGNMQIQPMFTKANMFQNGFALVTMNGSQRFINSQGNVQTTPSVTVIGPFVNDYCRIKTDEGQGLMDFQFNITVQPYYNYVGNMSKEGLASRKIGSSSDYKVQYIDGQGNIKIQTEDAVGGYDFRDGVAVVQVYNKRNEEYKWGAINQSGEMVISAKYDYLMPVGNGLLAFSEANNDGYYTIYKYGLIDTDGQKVVSAKYDEIKSGLADGLIAVREDYQWGFIDKEGEKVIRTKYESVYPFSEGYAFVKEDDRWYLIDEEGNTQVKLKENEVPYYEYVVNGLIITRLYDGEKYNYTYKDTEGETIYKWSTENYISPLSSVGAKSAPEKYYGF